MVSTRPRLDSVSPFFIVGSLERSLDWYRDRLGFTVTVSLPAEDPFFGIVQRDGASLLLKSVAEGVAARPNPSIHPWARWDAFVGCSDPAGLAEEFTAAGVMAEAVSWDDGLFGFELTDPDGHVIFFGRPD